MIVMLCTSARGGMRAVVEAYERDGFLRRWQVRVLSTHVEGPAVARSWAFLKALVTFLALLLRGEVRGLHCHVATRGSAWRKYAFARLAAWFGVPTILHSHGSETKLFFESQPPWLQRRFVSMLERADLVIALSDGWKSYFGAIAPKARVSVVPNYVTIPSPSSHPPGRPPGDTLVRVLFLGAVGPRKGIYDLLQAMPEVIARVPHVRLLIGGNGEIEIARQRARELGIEAHVEFLGWVSGDAKQTQLALADVYVLPSHNEGLPVSILEAMSFGLPIVSTDVGAIPEVVHPGVEGALIKPGNVNGLSNALIELCLDNATRQRMGHQALLTVRKNFAREVVLPRLDALYARHFPRAVRVDSPSAAIDAGQS